MTIATWWETAEWIATWPESKGNKAYFIRGYEIWGGDPNRVKATYRLPGRKLVISRWLKRLMAEEFGDPNATLIPNGVDRCQFFADERDKGTPATIGMLFGEARWKGAQTAFEAIRLVQEWNPEVKVVSFGSSAPARGQQVPRNFEFFQKPAQETIAGIYARSDCWIVPSTSEGFGMPGIEAAACRCPIVSTRCGGPEDYVENGVNGFLVPVGDANAMADGIIRVLSQSPVQWKQMSDASYEISQRFDWDKSAAILEETLLADLAKTASVVAKA